MLTSGEKEGRVYRIKQYKLSITRIYKDILYNTGNSSQYFIELAKKFCQAFHKQV